MGCKDRAGTADRVKAAAGTLADLQAHVADYPLAGTGRDWATERARVLAEAHVAMMAPVLEAIEGLKGGGSFDEQMRGLLVRGERGINALEVKVGDCFRVVSSSFRLPVGDVGEVVETVGRVARVEGKGWRWSGPATTLLDPKLFQRVRAVEAPRAYEPDGNERLATAEELAVPARDVACCFCVKSGEAYALLEDGRKCPRCGKSESDLVSAECDSEWGGMEPEDSGVDDLAGPAGEERAGVPSDAAQALADMTAQRNAWEAEATRAQAQAARGRQAARARIAELEARYEAMRADVATLVQAREAFGESEDIAWPALASAIEALSQRAVSW